MVFLFASHFFFFFFCMGGFGWKMALGCTRAKVNPLDWRHCMHSRAAPIMYFVTGRFIFLALLWFPLNSWLYTNNILVSLALKFRNIRVKTSSKQSRTPSHWKEKLTKHYEDIVFHKASIEELTKGLHLGNLLNLPHELTYNSYELVCLLATETFVRPFSQLKWVHFLCLFYNQDFLFFTRECCSAIQSYQSDEHLHYILLKLRAAYATYLSTAKMQQIFINKYGSTGQCLREVRLCRVIVIVEMFVLLLFFYVSPAA